MTYSSIDTNIRALLFAGILAAGCGTMAPPAPPTSIPTGGPAASASIASINRGLVVAAAAERSAPTSDYRIGPEDMLQITLYNVPGEASSTPRVNSVRVSQTGLINLPLLGDVSVTGSTVASLEVKLRQLYDKYIYNPQVGVLVTDFRQKASIVGAVQRPGEFVLSGPKTLIDLLSMAGGVRSEAGTQVHLYRRTPEGQQSYVIDLLVLASNPGSYNDQNINQPIYPGDVVNVPHAGMFFVYGAVRNPGSFPIDRRFTLKQALAKAGGLDIDLSSSDVMIYRRKESQEEAQTISVDFAAVLAGSAVDPPVESDDVIVVPVSTIKYVWNRYLFNILFGGMNIKSFIP